MKGSSRLPSFFQEMQVLERQVIIMAQFKVYSEKGEISQEAVGEGPIPPYLLLRAVARLGAANAEM